MSLPARKPATYEDLLEIPEHLVAEILDGELYTSPRPAPRHARASSMLGHELIGPFDKGGEGPHGPGGWWILDESELHLEDDIMVPDLAGWRRERLPEIPEEAWFTLAPDWVCEVLSPSTERLDRIPKKRLYGTYGVRHLWLINPVAETLEVLRLTPDGWLEVGAWSGDEVAWAEPFDAIELELARLWSRRRTPPAVPEGGRP